MVVKSTLIILSMFVVGCSTAVVTQTKKSLPKVYGDVNGTYQKKNDVEISLFRLNNYTDTPRAGMRAANIVEGILLTKGYKIQNHIKDKKALSFKKAKEVAKDDGSNYFLYGGISEWRYKTGIDGEPAISLQLSLYKAKNGKLVWSATGSDSDWGNGSLGTTAQNLIKSMMNK